MRKLIINMSRGLIESVYSDIPDEMEIREIDDHDEYDEDRSQEYWRNRWLIEKGCYTDILNAPNNKADSERILPPSRMEEKQLTSIVESVGKTVNGEKIAFLDGFLAVWGSLNQYSAALVYSRDPDERERGKQLSSLLNPLMEAWEKQYDALCDELWNTQEVA